MRKLQNLTETRRVWRVVRGVCGGWCERAKAEGRARAHTEISQVRVEYRFFMVQTIFFQELHYYLDASI